MTAIARFGDVEWMRFHSAHQIVGDDPLRKLCGHLRAAQRYEFGVLRDKSGVIGARKLPRSEWPGDADEHEIEDDDLVKLFCAWCALEHDWCECHYGDGWDDEDDEDDDE